MMRKLVMLLILLFATGVYFFAPSLALPYLLPGALLAVLVLTVFIDDEWSKARWMLVTIFLAHLTIFAGLGYLSLFNNSTLFDEWWQESILRLGILGVSVLFTAIFAIATVYISSVYMLSLHTAEEGLAIFQVMRSFVAVLLNTQYDWMIISEGEIKNTRPGGVMKQLGGPGKLIIDPGNAVVLQRSGKVSRVCGAGIVMTQRFENVKDIINLRNQFVPVVVDNVITADRIPLKITMGVGYRIKPADDPNAEGVIKDNLGLFAVDKKTILNAVYQNTGGKWTGFGGAAPQGQLRDQIMSYTLDELFPEGINGDLSKRKIEQIEGAILKKLNSFADGRGVFFTGVDIQQIELPSKVNEAIQIKIRAEAEAEAIQRIEDVRTIALGRLINEILGNLPEHERNTEAALNLVEVLSKQNKRVLTDDILGHQYLEMLSKMASADGTKIFTANGGQPLIENPISGS